MTWLFYEWFRACILSHSFFVLLSVTLILKDYKSSMEFIQFIYFLWYMWFFRISKYIKRCCVRMFIFFLNIIYFSYCSRYCIWILVSWNMRYWNNIINLQILFCLLKQIEPNMLILTYFRSSYEIIEWNFGYDVDLWPLIFN